MAKAAKKKSAVQMIVFSRARDIPFNRIRLSDDNVRQTDVELGLDELTHDIDRREDLVQGLNVRAILDEAGAETGDFETPAGGRRYRSIARLVEAGRFPADGLVPCIVKKADAKTSAVDGSLAENVRRLALHPLDQFKAFKRMVDGGMTTGEVASAYFTTQRYVEQRMALAKVSPVLHEAYPQNSMTLAQLEAFTANPHHDRQEQVWDALKQSHYREPWRIRNMLTETSVPASDRRAVFVGIDAYMAAGGPVLPRYLFDDDEDGWLEDVPLLDRLVSEKLKTIAGEIAAEGWKWVAVEIARIGEIDTIVGRDRDIVRCIERPSPKQAGDDRAFAGDHIGPCEAAAAEIGAVTSDQPSQAIEGETVRHTARRLEDRDRTIAWIEDHQMTALHSRAPGLRYIGEKYPAVRSRCRAFQPESASIDSAYLSAPRDDRAIVTRSNRRRSGKAWEGREIDLGHVSTRDQNVSQCLGHRRERGVAGLQGVHDEAVVRVTLVRFADH